MEGRDSKGEIWKVKGNDGAGRRCERNGMGVRREEMGIGEEIGKGRGRKRKDRDREGMEREGIGEVRERERKR